MKKITTLFICLLAAAAAVAQTGSAASTKWITQQDTAFKFSFQYPGDWELKLPATETRFFVTSKAENENDHFRENINCIVKTINQPGFKIKDAENDLKESLKQQMDDFKLLSSSYKKWLDTDALCMDYSTTKKSGDEVFLVRIYQQIAVYKGTLFVFTYTAESRSYAKYKGVINKLLQSVKILP